MLLMFILGGYWTAQVPNSSMIIGTEINFRTLFLHIKGRGVGTDDLEPLNGKHTARRPFKPTLPKKSGVDGDK